jgi:hypothetical protein
MMGRTYLRLGQTQDAEPALRRAGIYKPFSRGPLGREDRELATIRRAAQTWAKQRAQQEKKCSRGSAKRNEAVNQADLSVPERATLYAPVVKNPAHQVATPSDAGFYDPARQQEIDLLLFVELGAAPVRGLAGTYLCESAIFHAAYPERRCEVDIDGTFVGETVRIMDFWHQAKTRGAQPETKLQYAKAAGKYAGAAALSLIPFAGDIASSAFESLWDISADPRSWFLLPGEMHVLGVRVDPGPHTITLRFYDWNNEPLPRYTQTWYSISAPDQGDRVLLLAASENKQNQLHVQARTTTKSSGTAANK